MRHTLGLIILALSLTACASTAAQRDWLWQGEVIHHTNARRVDRSLRPGLGVVVNRGTASALTVLVFPGRYALQGRQDGLFVPDSGTGKLQLVREPIHRVVLTSAMRYGPEVTPTEYWLWLPPERDYTVLALTWQGGFFGLSPRVLDTAVHHIRPDGRVFDQQYAGRPVDWKLEVRGTDTLPSLQEALGIPRNITIDLRTLNPFR
jgi:hypothetical protein